MSGALFEHFLSQWAFTRGLTKDLLESLSQAELDAAPVPGLGPWWKQFRHIGRVQENYIAAIKTKKVKFSPEGATYSGGASKQALLEYLDAVDSQLKSAINAAPKGLKIGWFGEEKVLAQHLMYLADHEVLHHGQWVAYCACLDGKFPKSWSTWGL